MKAPGSGLAFSGMLELPRCVLGHDDEAVVDLVGVARLVLGDEQLVQLLAGADADDLDLGVGRQRRRHVGDPHRRHARDERLAAAHARRRVDDELHGLIERDPEARHALVGDRDDAGLGLELEQRHDRAARADDVAVAHRGEARRRVRGVGVGLVDDLLRGELRRAVEVDRVDGLVGRQVDGGRHVVLDRRGDDVLGAEDVRAHRLERVVLADRNVLEGGRVDDRCRHRGSRGRGGRGRGRRR